MSQQSLMKMARCVACLVAMAMVGSVQAAWVMIDDFESGFGFDENTQTPVLLSNGANGWIVAGANDGSIASGWRHIAADPLDSTNQALRFTGGGGTGTGKQVLAGEGLADGSTGTAFLRFYMDTQVGVAFGLGGSATTTNTTSTAGTIGFGDTGTAPNTVMNGFTSTAASSITPMQTMAVDTWYNLWIVLENAANADPDTVNFYVQGGAFAVPTLLSGVGPITDFTSRGNIAAELVQVAFRPANSNRSSASGAAQPDGGILYIDDMYINNAGEDLTNPVPEPSSLAMFCMGAMGIGLRRFRGRK